MASHTAKWLVKSVRAHGVATNASRNRPLVAVATKLPAAVIADMFGTYLNTAPVQSSPESTGLIISSPGVTG